MAHKLNKADHMDDNRMIEAVRGSVDQIWQAGLGAFVKAQQEGEEVFSRLVQEGAAVQKRTREMAGEQLSGISETVAHMAESLGKQASGSWEKLESVFEDRVSQALRGIGVPTHDDIQALGDRIGELQQMVNTLVSRKEGGRSAAKKPAARAAAKKPAASAAKKAAPKKAAPKKVAPKKAAPKRGARAASRKAATSAASRA